jgi:hypothetical protein
MNDSRNASQVLFEFKRTYSCYKKDKGPYNFVGGGTYNHVFVSKEEIDNRKIVIKESKTPHQDELSNAMRAARIYQQINPEDKKFVATDEENDRWCLPYVTACDEKPTDEKLAAAVLDIHNNTGRIVFDATVDGNFIPTMVDNTVKYKLVDVDQAMLLPSQTLQRRGSDASLNYFGNDYFSKEQALQWVNKHSKAHPKTMATIVYLLTFVDNLDNSTKTKLFNALSPRAKNHFNSFQDTQTLDNKDRATQPNVSCKNNRSLTHSRQSIAKAAIWSILWVSLGIVLAFSGIELFAIFTSSLIVQGLIVAAAVFIGAIGAYFFLQQPQSTIYGFLPQSTIYGFLFDNSTHTHSREFESQQPLTTHLTNQDTVAQQVSKLGALCKALNICFG